MTGNPAFRLPEQYDRLIGRYSGDLARLMCDGAKRRGCRVFGMDVKLVHPPEFELMPDRLDVACDIPQYR